MGGGGGGHCPLVPPRGADTAWRDSKFFKIHKAYIQFRVRELCPVHEIEKVQPVK